MRLKPINLILSRPEKELPNGASHFWGCPDLPVDFDFPTYIDSDGDEFPYVFICQINLAELAKFAPGNPLPHTGLLSFFAKIDCYLGDFEAHDYIGGSIGPADDVKVLYFPSMDNLQETILMDEEDNELALDPLAIEFGHEIPESGDEHMLFAPPTHREWESWDAPFEDNIILLQVDSFEGEDFELNFMDCGVLDFLISPTDLKNHKFDNVRAIVLST